MLALFDGKSSQVDAEDGTPACYTMAARSASACVSMGGHGNDSQHKKRLPLMARAQRAGSTCRGGGGTQAWRAFPGGGSRSGGHLRRQPGGV